MYFSDQKDIDAVLGRLLREQNELKTRLTALKAEASDIGNELSALGFAVSGETERVVIAGQVHSVQEVPLEFSAALLDPKRIAALAQDIRDTTKALTKCISALAEAGYRLD